MEPWAVDHLVQALDQQCATLPDCRKGKHTQDAINDAALGALAVFFTQAPSFLAYQRTRRPAKGRSHANSLCGMGEMPCDHQIRTLLHPSDPAQLFPVFEGVSAALERSAPLGACRTCAGPWLIAFDGTEYFSSQAIHGDRCSQRTQRNGQVTYVHQVLTPVLVAPGNPEVLALEPAFITPQDGHETQDGEQVAAKRWIERQAGRYPHVTLWGDALYCTQPFGELWRRHDGNLILVCHPESHTTLYAWLVGGEAAGDLQQFTVGCGKGRFRPIYTYRSANDVPWREGADAWWVNWCELTITKATDGTLLYRHALATPHQLDRTTVEAVVPAGRARWNIETEHHKTLQTTGDHLEHHDGHGQQHLAAVWLTLNLLALLCHTVLGWTDHQYQWVRQALAARQTFFQDLQALTRDLLLERWDQLLDFMLQGLEIAVPPDPS